MQIFLRVFKSDSTMATFGADIYKLGVFYRGRGPVFSGFLPKFSENMELNRNVWSASISAIWVQQVSY